MLDMDYFCDTHELIDEAISEADAEIQPKLDLCTALECLGIRVEYPGE